MELFLTYFPKRLTRAGKFPDASVRVGRLPPSIAFESRLRSIELLERVSAGRWGRTRSSLGVFVPGPVESILDPNKLSAPVADTLGCALGGHVFASGDNYRIGVMIEAP